MKWTLLSLWTVSVLLCFLESVVGQTQRNVTVDDQNSAITYAPSSTSWTLTDPGEWDAGDGRAHMLAEAADAVATFTFTGVAVYYWAAMWPYSVLTTVTIDGSSTLVNLTDPSPPPDAGLPPSRQSSILFSATNLSNTTHTVRITVGSGNFAIVDFFTYTVLETTPTTTTTTSGGGGTATTTKSGGSSGASATDGGVASPSKGLSTAVKVGIAVAVIGFLLLLLVLFFILRWLKRRKEEAEKSMVVGFHPHSPDPNMSGVSGNTTGMGHPNISLPMTQNSMWTDPDYVEANRRMNLPVAYPYQQTGSRSSVRLVPPETNDPRLSDGSDYPSSSFMNPSPAPPVPSPGAQAVHDIYNFYSQPNPPPARPNPTYNYYNSSYGR